MFLWTNSLCSIQIWNYFFATCSQWTVLPYFRDINTLKLWNSSNLKGWLLPYSRGEKTFLTNRLRHSKSGIIFYPSLESIAVLPDWSILQSCQVNKITNAVILQNFLGIEKNHTRFGISQAFGLAIFFANGNCEISTRKLCHICQVSKSSGNKYQNKDKYNI